MADAWRSSPDTHLSLQTSRPKLSSAAKFAGGKCISLQLLPMVRQRRESPANRTNVRLARSRFLDIDQMRQIRYPLPEQDVSDKAAQAIVENSDRCISKLKDGDLPFYRMLPISSHIPIG